MDVSCTDISKYTQPHITLFIQLLELQKIQGEKERKVEKPNGEITEHGRSFLCKVWMLFGVSGLIETTKHKAEERAHDHLLW